MSRELIIDSLSKLGKEVWELLVKWGLWFIVLFFTVLMRVFYEILKSGKTEAWKLFVIAGLGFSAGIVSMILCIKNGMDLLGLIIMIISVLASYRAIDYIVNIDVKEIIKDALKSALEKIVKK